MEFEKGKTCTMSKTNTEINKKLNQTNFFEGFYADTVILLTEATDFMGKGLLEKLMRVYPRIAAIFILLHFSYHTAFIAAIQTLFRIYLEN